MAIAHFFYDNDFDSFFENSKFYPPSTLGRKKREDSINSDSKAFRPRLDLHENKEANLITATFELPGMKKEDVIIDVHQDSFTISGDVSASNELKDDEYTIRERKLGKFSRTVKLPKGTNAKDLKAKMENGLLSVTYPATQPENAPARISID